MLVILSVTIPLFEFLEGDSVGETLSANTNSLKYTVTSQLMKDKIRVNYTCFLQFVGNDAADEVRRCGVQSVHQLVQLFLSGNGKLKHK